MAVRYGTWSSLDSLRTFVSVGCIPSATCCPSVVGWGARSSTTTREEQHVVRLIRGIMMPGKLFVVQRVFSDNASEDWFTNSAGRRGQFAAYIPDAYRSGVTDPHSLALMPLAGIGQVRSVASMDGGTV